MSLQGSVTSPSADLLQAGLSCGVEGRYRAIEAVEETGKPGSEWTDKWIDSRSRETSRWTDKTAN